MAKAAGGKGEIARRNSDHLSFQEIVPHAAWSEDQNSHCLLVDLPGFKEEEVKLQADQTPNHLKVSGERQVSELKYVWFEQTFKVPKNSDMEKTTGNFEGEILCIIVPKQVEQRKEASNQQNGTASPVVCDVQEGRGHGFVPEIIDDGERNEQCEDVEKDTGVLDSVITSFRNNKGILITAVLAFSLGVLVTQKFESDRH